MQLEITHLFSRWLFTLLLLACPLLAKSLYVNGSTGNDETTYANNDADNPWATIGRAAWGSTNRASPVSAQAAQAGDTVFVAAGVYTTTGTGERWGVAYQPVNSGSSGNLIVFYAQGMVDLRYSSGSGPVIGSSSAAYIEWNGFFIDEQHAVSTSDTGPIIIGSTSANYVRIIGCTIDGNGDPGYGDNHNGIRIESTSNAYVANNKIYSVRTSGVNGNNGAGIMFYGSSNAVVEHNEIYDCGSGIFVKGPNWENDDPNSDITIRYNLIYNI